MGGEGEAVMSLDIGLELPSLVLPKGMQGLVALSVLCLGMV